jgi:phosphoserine aminotransferase
MVNKVIFSPTGVNANNSLYNTPPVKALSVLPDWYKDLAGYRHGSSK